ncbi:unnamed protein product [Phytophthora lilii]|uniref:Unnamed protein product n=1 Tax=Phytophthora lilii TaxID=2077276 RepID=A0A9W6U621_9STRA|nr:unnamed protein product [Phytophthora lilii]
MESDVIRSPDSGRVSEHKPGARANHVTSRSSFDLTCRRLDERRHEDAAGAARALVHGALDAAVHAVAVALAPLPRGAPAAHDAAPGRLDGAALPLVGAAPLRAAVRVLRAGAERAHAHPAERGGGHLRVLGGRADRRHGLGVWPGAGGQRLVRHFLAGVDHHLFHRTEMDDATAVADRSDGAGPILLGAQHGVRVRHRAPPRRTDTTKPATAADYIVSAVGADVQRDEEPASDLCAQERGVPGGDPAVFSTFGVCVWWSIETITSLGYGDVVPITSMGRVLGASLALWGIVLFAIPGAILGSGFIEVMLEKQREEEAEMYSMAMGAGSSINSNNPLFVGSFSDDEQFHEHHTDHEHPEFAAAAAAHTPISMASPNSSSSPRLAAAMRIEALHHKVETITAGQVRADLKLLSLSRKMLTRAVSSAISSRLLADADGFFADGFAKRQFDDKSYSGTQLAFDKQEFVKKVNEIYEANGKQLVDGYALCNAVGGCGAMELMLVLVCFDSYAPFCKHLFVKNFTGARLNMVPITQANAHMLMSDYEARTEYELPVHSVTPKVAEYLDIILYSREQITKENEAVDVPADPSHGDAPWGIVSIKAQDVDYELPMKPITMMRNAVGKEQGGSGVPIDRDEYMKAVEYWRNHAVIKKI